jgi:hypothetical protein
VPNDALKVYTKPAGVALARSEDVEQKTSRLIVFTKTARGTVTGAIIEDLRAESHVVQGERRVVRKVS